MRGVRKRGRVPAHILGFTPARQKRRRRGAIARRQRGFVRTAGFYGRYAGKLAEHKFHDLDVTDAVIATGGSIDTPSLVVIAQGTDESTRIGRKITIKAIHWRYTLVLPTTATAASTSDTARILVFLDKQTNGAAATVTGILESANYQSFNNLANKSRFRILFDQTWALNCPSGSGRGTSDTLSYGETRIDGEWHKQCNIPIEYDNTFTTGVIGTQRTNNIGVLTISGAGLVGLVASKFRLRFTDV